MDRRQFLGLGGACGIAFALGSAHESPTLTARQFSRRYAPHLGQFRHLAPADPIDQIRFLADRSFTAVEDGGFCAKPPVLQLRIADELARRGMSMGLIGGVCDYGRPSFTSGCPALRRAVLQEVDRAIAAARRGASQTIAIVPGKCAPFIPASEQHRNVVDLLRQCAERCQPYGIRLVLEAIDHGCAQSRLYLRTSRQAAALCRAVGSSSCGFLLDVHQQSTLGQDFWKLVSATADVLAYVHLADYPGRKEPGTGIVRFDQVLGLLDRVGYRGCLGMEHGASKPGRAGEQAVLDAYAALDRYRWCAATADFHSATSRGLISKMSIE